MHCLVLKGSIITRYGFHLTLTVSIQYSWFKTLRPKVDNGEFYSKKGLYFRSAVKIWIDGQFQNQSVLGRIMVVLRTWDKPNWTRNDPDLWRQMVSEGHNTSKTIVLININYMQSHTWYQWQNPMYEDFFRSVVYIFHCPECQNNLCKSNHFVNRRLQWPLLLTWFNFNPSMDK